MAVASAITGVGAATADTFTYSGGQQFYTIPVGITGLHVVLVGGTGASEMVPDLTGTGGHGARLTADIPVPAGTTTLYVEVGGNGVPANPPTVGYAMTGGFNGGGNGPFGGGGASDIRTVAPGQPNSLGTRLAVAGGGGGAAGNGNVGYNANGGDAGNSDGSGSKGAGLLSGTGATTTAAGQPTTQALVTSSCQSESDTDGEHGDPGSVGGGGSGAFLLISGTPLSGGGGGGVNGGGGGAQCYNSPGATATQYAGAGGGGSSGAPTGQNVTITTDANDPAEVTITAPVPSPSDLVPPTVAGGLTVGDVLAESHATWSSSLPLSGYTYRWERCDPNGGSCSAIPGATAQTYQLAAADVGHVLQVKETASNFYGPSSVAITSAPTGVVSGQTPTTVDPPTITGATTQGQMLIASHAPWSGGPILGYSDQWERCDASGGSCLPINGAVDQTYTLSAADVGSTLRVNETATNAYGTSPPTASSPTAVVQAVSTPTPGGGTADRKTLRLLRIRQHSDAVLVTLVCAADGAACNGVVTLRHSTIAITKRHGKRHRHRRTLVVDRASYSIGPGRSKTITVVLNPAGRSLLKRHRQLQLKGTITLRPKTGPSTTVINFTLTLKRGQGVKGRLRR